MAELIRTFVQLNRDIIYFVYGLSFFVLGLAIALQSRRSSRLDLARSLSWLAAFGFTHGFHEWGEYFIPIQAEYLSAPAVDLLHALRLILLAVSFACLFEFGIRLLGNRQSFRRLSAVNAGLLAAWLLIIFGVLPGRVADVELRRNIADALARYFIGFPAGLLSSYALRRHTFERIVPLNMPHIVRTLQLAGVGLGVYALLGGLIPPPVPFPPGSLINAAAFERAFLVPPAVLRSLIGLFLAVTTIRALEVFELEMARRLEAMEQEQILLAERERLARDLHDGAIQKVYSAGLIVESAQNLVPGDEELGQRLGRAVSALNDAMRDLRRSLGDLSPPPPAEPLKRRLERLSQDPRFKTFVDIQLDLDIPDSLELDPLKADHILAITNEALSNAVRHAKAGKVSLELSRENDRLSLRIEDDGIGMPGETPSGFGLRNMRDRARLLDGALQIEGRPGRGTRVLLEVPLGEAT